MASLRVRLNEGARPAFALGGMDTRNHRTIIVRFECLGYKIDPNRTVHGQLERLAGSAEGAQRALALGGVETRNQYGH